MTVRKNSKLIRSGYYVFSGRGEFLNCLHCSALALLLHSAIKWLIQYPRTEKELCGISKSEMLASKCDPEGKKGERGEGSQCGTRRGKGRDLPQDLVSHRVLLQHYNKIRGEPNSEPHLIEKKAIL